MQVEQAIDTHGAEAVYQAAARYLEGDSNALVAVGLEVEDLSEAWRIQSTAWQAMPLEDQAAEYLESYRFLAGC
ncbi:hypothetical protein [Vreelandella utahensis]|uniref:Uncharacterized protein n=2 Tax=Halomonadaceae TaxID=28256 RepID=A0A9X4YES9_9GAMM|nr:hypothetical protein [Halomonas utahensis]MYL27888.1 hypothetical protein [Halomonas utahensis]